MPPKYKYLSGCQKLKKAKKAIELTKSQEGAIHNYFPSKPKSSNVVGEQVDVTMDEVVDEDAVVNDNVNEEDFVNDNVNEDGNENANQDDVDDNMNEDDVSDNVNVNEDDVDDNLNEKFDIFDPRNWEGLDSNMINDLVEKGPERGLTTKTGPLDNIGRHYSSSMHTRVLSNGETCDREWLVYSQKDNKLFCFCCKLFKQGLPKGTLDGDGFNKWKHASPRLKEHEVGLEHLKNMKTWFEMRQRLGNNKTIDKVVYDQYKKERDYWKQVITRIITLVRFLAKYGLAFRGTNEKLYHKGNGNFLGLVEMLEEFDPIIKEHVRRILNDELKTHYLAHNIQNEIILLLANEVKSEIIKKIKQAKYYSIILDCTPDISHQEQMTIIVRYVNFNSDSVTVEESFLGFLIVGDTTGKGLFDITLEELKSLGLDIDHMRGQGYDNGSNMKGKHQGVQKRFLDINPRALCDMANTCAKSREFFGVIQRLYTIFAKSTKRWQILKENVTGLTLKSLSTTRWESRVDSVKPIRNQLVDVREALLEIEATDNDAQIQSEAKSLARNDIGEFEFLVSLVIWCEILTMVNVVSKNLQKKDMLIDVAIEDVKKLVAWFKKYREVGFSKSIIEAKEIAIEMGVDPVFTQKRVIKRKKHFDETSNEQEVLLSLEDTFKVNYFLVIVDQAITSLETRFEQYQQFEKLFGFLFPKKLRQLEEKDLKSCCLRLQDSLTYGETSDLDGIELYTELKLLETFMPKEVSSPLDVLKHLKHVGWMPNALVAYRVMLTIPVTVASAERSFLKLKLLKTYLRSTMTQDRLNGLAILSIESDMLENVDYEALINNFATKNARRAARFV